MNSKTVVCCSLSILLMSLMSGGARASQEHVSVRARERATESVRFGDLDVDNNGEISRHEWQYKRNLFNRLDANEDQLVSQNEFNGQGDTLIDRILGEILEKL